MNIVVCAKQIPDPAVPGALNADHTLKREGKLILDDSDRYGVEMALQLVEAAGGVLEFSDLLKRPIDAFRYLQLTLETGQVSLSQQTVFTNVVMVGSANDVHLEACRAHHEYPSFRGRIELVRVPYLRSYLDEERIYAEQILPTFRRHVAPYTARLAAEFAVLTRLRKPDPSRYDKALADVVKGLSAVDKLVLYAEGEPPASLDNEKKKLLRANVAKLYDEWSGDVWSTADWNS